MDGSNMPPEERSEKELPPGVIIIPFDFVGFEKRMALFRDAERNKKALEGFGAGIFGFGVHF